VKTPTDSSKRTGAVRFRIWAPGSGVWGLGCRVWDLGVWGFEVLGVGVRRLAFGIWPCGVQCFAFSASHFAVRVSGLGNTV